MKALNSFVSITFLILALTLIGSAPAAAARYEWRSASGGGNWASAVNWTVVEGPAGVGYPNQAGDVAEFGQSEANRTITINQSITLARLVINDDNDVLLFTTSNGRLVFDTPFTDPSLTTMTTAMVCSIS